MYALVSLENESEVCDSKSEIRIYEDILHFDVQVRQVDTMKVAESLNKLLHASLRYSLR